MVAALRSRFRLYDTGRDQKTERGCTRPIDGTGQISGLDGHTGIRFPVQRTAHNPTILIVGSATEVMSEA